MKVLVTGSNGFVGSHLTETLIERGHKVVCQVRNTSNVKWLKNLNVEYFYGDVRDKKAINEMVKGVEAVIHNAAVLRSLKKDHYYEVNQISTRNIAEALLKYNPSLKKMIFISSQAAMGPGENIEPKKTVGKECPISDYGLSKLAGEKELKILDNKIPYTVLRPASVYGPRDKDIFIFFKLVNYGLIPAPFKKRYLQLLFVKDLALAAAKSIENSRSDFKTYFLAENKPYLWQEVGETIARALSKKAYLLPLPDFLFHLTAFFSEAAGYCTNTPAVINRQKVREMHECFWVGDNADSVRDLAMDFTKLEIGAKITYNWYKENHWL